MNLDTLIGQLNYLETRLAPFERDHTPIDKGDPSSLKGQLWKLRNQYIEFKKNELNLSQTDVQKLENVKSKVVDLARRIENLPSKTPYQSTISSPPGKIEDFEDWVKETGAAQVENIKRMGNLMSVPEETEASLKEIAQKMNELSTLTSQMTDVISKSNAIIQEAVDKSKKKDESKRDDKDESKRKDDGTI